MLRALGGQVDVLNLPAQRGDVRHRAADTSVARTAFGYTPTVGLADGLTDLVGAERPRMVGHP
jgi:nucleoside-diphosphate-sugar epimerase